MSLRNLRKQAERLRPPPEPEPVIIRHVVIPRGPCGYLVRSGVSEEEWSAFDATHGHEATDEAREFLAAWQAER